MSTVKFGSQKLRTGIGVILILLAITLGLVLPTLDPRTGSALRNSFINLASTGTVSISLSATPSRVPVYQRVTFTGSTTGLADGTQLDIYLYLGGDVHQSGGTNPYALSVYVYSGLFSTSAAVYMTKEGDKCVLWSEWQGSWNNYGRLWEGYFSGDKPFEFYADYPNPPPPNNIVSNMFDVTFVNQIRYTYTIWIADRKVFENGVELIHEVTVQSNTITTKIQFASDDVPSKVWLNVAAIDPCPNPEWHGILVEGRQSNNEMTKLDAKTWQITEYYPNGKFEFKLTTGGYIGDPNAVILLAFMQDSRPIWETWTPLAFYAILLGALGAVLVISGLPKKRQ